MTTAAHILIVDDDAIIADSLAEFLRREGYLVSIASSADAALKALSQAASPANAATPAHPVQLVISDVSLPGTDGIALLRSIRKEHPGTAVIMLTGYGTIEGAVEALRIGAVDYLTKPVVDQELRTALERGLQQQALLAENVSLRRQVNDRYNLGNIVGSDPRMRKLFDLVEAVAPTKTTVLMSGESGVGKSLIAHAIHQRSPRKDKAFVEISCGSIPETLLESELFGHVKGAFTGAYADKAGRFLAANGGTIFLDEINSAPPSMQLKLLRVLQERKFEPVGSTQTIEVDVRVVLASNHPLEDLVAKGTFRQDLYYRINVVKIELPPLRERPADIQILADTFLKRHASDLGKQIIGFTPEAVESLLAYTYPGNVRELQNIIERAAVLTKDQRIQRHDLPPQVLGEGPSRLKITAATASTEADAPWVPMTLEDALRDPERRILLRALKANNWNRQKTADQLAINRTTLYKKMKALGLLDPSEDDTRLAG
ncbi:MAG: sigma-54 dependent transcriptional regulator [Planctomycetes bacterium]|nr:sigma-54 dependent transcriptional regulator [Planctomycetota bacterium]